MNDVRFLGEKLYSIGDRGIPLHKNINVKFKLSEKLLKNKEKLVAVRVNIKSQEAVSSKIENQLLSIKTKEFGKFAIHIDTIPPSIKLINNNLESEKRKIVFKVEDNLSGISKYIGQIDNQWILLKYDPKVKKLYYDIDKYIEKKNKKRMLKVRVEDAKRNVSEKMVEFYY